MLSLFVSRMRKTADGQVHRAVHAREIRALCVEEIRHPHPGEDGGKLHASLERDFPLEERSGRGALAPRDDNDVASAYCAQALSQGPEPPSASGLMHANCASTSLTALVDTPVRHVLSHELRAPPSPSPEAS